MSFRSPILYLMLAFALPLAAQAALDPDLDRSIRQRRDLLRESPNSWDLRTAQARDLSDAGDLLDSEESLPLLEEALALADALAAEHPDSAESHYLMALARGKRALFLGGKEKVRLSREIKTSIDRAIALNHDHADAHVLRGAYYFELATLSRVLRVFAKLLYGGLPPGSLADSRADLERAVLLDPDGVSAHYYLARTLWRLDEAESALEHCRRCRLLPPTEPTHSRDQADAAALEHKILKKTGRNRRKGR
jgi:tetratricopeptide (TPR) repeat protein